ncbi:MAG: hypothetical protein ACOX5N_07080 [Bacilli bacterium]
MGVAGGAYGTLAANVIIAPIFMVMLFWKNPSHIYLRAKDIVYDSALIGKIFRLSWPVGVSQAFTSLGFLILNSVVYRMATRPLTLFRSVIK